MHVHVHSGGQAIVGMVETPGEGIDRNQRINPMQSKLPMHMSPRCRARTRAGDALPIASDAERALPNARRQGAGRAQGQ